MDKSATKKLYSLPAGLRDAIHKLQRPHTRVAWVNPTEDAPACIAWLEAGAAVKAVRNVPAGM